MDRKICCPARRNYKFWLWPSKFQQIWCGYLRVVHLSLLLYDNQSSTGGLGALDSGPRDENWPAWQLLLAFFVTSDSCFFVLRRLLSVTIMWPIMNLFSWLKSFKKSIYTRSLDAAWKLENHHQTTSLNGGLCNFLADSHTSNNKLEGMLSQVY